MLTHCLQVNRNYWGHAELRPPWWVDEVPLCNIYKAKYKKEKLRILLHSYKSYQTKVPTPMMETVESPINYSPSSHITDNDQLIPSQHSVSSSPPPLEIKENVVIHIFGHSDVDTSNDSFSHEIPKPLQPQSDTSHPQPVLRHNQSTQ